MSTRKRRSPGDGSLFKRSSDGLWVGSVEVPTADGKRRPKRVSAKDYKTAKRKLDELRAAVQSGNIPISDNTTVAAWLNRWLEIKRRQVRQGTYNYYEESIRLHIVPHIGHLKLRQLTPEHVRGMLEQATTTANAQRSHKTLKLALKTALTDGLLARNVVEAVDKPDHAARERGALTADAAALAIKTAIALEESRGGTSTDPWLASRWAAAFLTGGRPAELRGLEWDRVDFDNAVMDLAWQLQPLKKAHGCGEAVDKTFPCRRTRPGWCPQARWDFKPGFEYRDCHRSTVWTRPKTKAGTRIVPIVPPLLAMLNAHRLATAGQPNPYGLVWHHVDGRPIAPKDDAADWGRVLTAAQLPAVEVYAARHTATTLLQQVGVPEDVRMQITGHSSAAAHREYVHIDQSQTRSALGKLEQLLLG